MTDVPSRDFSVALAVLFEKGIRYKTVIDVGCADGHFFLQCLDFFPDATPVNIDANSLYEPSLKAIQEVVGGHYLIAAVSDESGEVEMTTSVHPYWSSLRPQDDPYWQRINRLHESKIKVPAVTLDSLARKLELAPPFLLKLDVQGAEVQALRGAREVLAETAVVDLRGRSRRFRADQPGSGGSRLRNLRSHQPRVPAGQFARLVLSGLSQPTPRRHQAAVVLGTGVQSAGRQGASRPPRRQF